MSLQISPLTAADVTDAVRIQMEAFTPDLREDASVFHNRIARYGQHYKMARLNGEPVGYVICFPWELGDSPVNNENFPEQLPAPSCFFIHDIAVLKRARGAGVARAMLEAAYEESRSLGFNTASLVAVGQSGNYWDKAGYTPYPQITETKRARVLEIYGPGSRLMVRQI